MATDRAEGALFKDLEQLDLYGNVDFTDFVKKN